MIELERPTSYFLHALTLAQATPMRADVLDANGGRWPAESPSTGPYRIERYLREQEIRLVPNSHYWDRSVTLLPAVFKIIPDESQAVSLFEAGKLDVVGRVPPLDLERMRKHGFVREYYQASTYFLAFNTRKPPFNDRDFAVPSPGRSTERSWSSFSAPRANRREAGSLKASRASSRTRIRPRFLPTR